MIGVFLGDENIWDGASIANLTTALGCVLLLFLIENLSAGRMCSC